MSVWDDYHARVSAHGQTKRDAMKIREERLLIGKVKDSLSYHAAIVDGIERSVSIINSDNLNQKTMISLPGEDFTCGGMVEWANNHWLITEKDANNEIYTKVKLYQCNYLLNWVDDFGCVRQQWCVIEDGTKYMTGEFEDRNFVVTRGDARVSMMIGRNDYTAQFGRERRFIIDDPGSNEKLAYALTKPLKVGRTYNNEGIYSFVLQETASTDDDNFELGIADYYKYFPKYPEIKPHTCGVVCAAPEELIDDPEDPPIDDNGKKVWL